MNSRTVTPTDPHGTEVLAEIERAMKHAQRGTEVSAAASDAAVVEIWDRASLHARTFALIRATGDAIGGYFPEPDQAMLEPKSPELRKAVHEGYGLALGLFSYTLVAEEEGITDTIELAGTAFPEQGLPSTLGQFAVSVAEEPPEISLLVMLVLRATARWDTA